MSTAESARAVIERLRLARTVETVTTETGTVTIPKVCDLVFHRKGQPVGDFRKAWRRACIAGGLAQPMIDDETGRQVTDRKGRPILVPTLRFHDLRRSCVQNLENAGTPRKVAKSITDHITDSTYERYSDKRISLRR